MKGDACHITPRFSTRRSSFSSGARWMNDCCCRLVCYAARAADDANEANGWTEHRTSLRCEQRLEREPGGARSGQADQEARPRSGDDRHRRCGDAGGCAARLRGSLQRGAAHSEASRAVSQVDHPLRYRCVGYDLFSAHLSRARRRGRDTRYDERAGHFAVAEGASRTTWRKCAKSGPPTARTCSQSPA